MYLQELPDGFETEHLIANWIRVSQWLPFALGDRRTEARRRLLRHQGGDMTGLRLRSTLALGCCAPVRARVLHHLSTWRASLRERARGKAV